MREINNKNDMIKKDVDMKDEMEMETEISIPIPNEVSLKYDEWLESPFPVSIIEVQKVIKTGSWLVIGTGKNSENPTVIYKIFFPSYYQVFYKVKEKIENGSELIMYIEDNKIKFKDDLPF